MGLNSMQSSDLLNNSNAAAGAATKVQQQAASSYLEAEDHLRKKARLSLDGGLPPSPTIPISELVSVDSGSEEQPAPDDDPVQKNDEGADDKGPAQAKSGRWSLDEKLMFLYGLSLFGKGRWKKIHAYVPDRSLVQIKSHAQKVLKRVDAGENVFQRLEDNRERLKVLVAEANQKIEEKEAQLNESPKKKRKRVSTRKPTTPMTVPPLIASPWDIIQRQTSSGSQQQQQHQEQQETRPSRKAEDAPSTSSSPAPSLSSEDPPGVHASQQYDDATTRLHTARSNTAPGGNVPSTVGVPNGGTGAVIAAVAALCQLSARSDP